MFAEALELKEKGELRQALDILFNLKIPESALTWFEKQIMIIEIQRLQGDYQKALTSIEIAKLTKNKILEKIPIIDYWIEIETSYVLWRQMHLNWDYESFICLEDEILQFEEHSNYFKLKSNKAIVSDFYHLVGLIHYSKGKYAESTQYNKKSLSFREDKRTPYANTVMNIGINFMHLSSLQLASEMYYQAMEILEQVGNKTTLAHLYNNMGVCYQKMGKNLDALQYFEKSLEIDKKIGLIPKIANVYQNIGIVYTIQGKYADALEIHQLSLDLKKKQGTLDDIGSSLAWIGQCYVLKGDFYLARKIFLESLEIKQNIGNDHSTALTLVDLIKLHYLKPDINTPTYMKELKYISETSNNNYLELLYLLCEGLSYKENPNFDKIVNAGKNFTIIYEHELSDFELKYNSLIHLTELKLLEYKLFNSDDVLRTLKEFMENFYELSKKSDSIVIHLEALILDISINNTESKFVEALEKISEGLEISHQNALYYHHKLFLDYKHSIRDKLENFRTIVKGTQEILQEVDDSSFDTYLDHVLQANWSKP